MSVPVLGTDTMVTTETTNMPSIRKAHEYVVRNSRADWDRIV